MSSQHRLYQSTIDGFLASLDRIGEQLGRSSSPKASRPHSQTALPDSLLSEAETQLLEEAVADIERIMQDWQAEAI